MGSGNNNTSSIQGGVGGYVSGIGSYSYRESQRHDVCYSCGSCGYELNLSSSNRNTATIGSKYGKSIKRGFISFFQIDETRFIKVDEIKCVPYFISKTCWGFFRTRTKLLCRKCGNHIGDAYDVKGHPYPYPYPTITDGCSACPDNELAAHKKFDIKIRALQPASSNQAATPLVV